MLDKKYDHIKVEEGKYASWIKHNYFKAGDLTKEAFSIVIPSFLNLQGLVLP